MPKLNLTVSPDFKPDKIGSWYIFNTYFQRQNDLEMSLSLYNDFDELHNAVKSGQVDLIYANPYDAAMLVNEYNFSPMVKPAGKNDECVIVVSAKSEVEKLEDLQPGMVIAATNDPSINMIGMRTIESVDLDETNTSTIEVGSFVAIAKAIMDDKAQIGFMLKEAYDELSKFVKDGLKVILESEISVIYHSLMLGPNLADKHEQLTQALLGMNSDDKGKDILKELGLDEWEEMTYDDAAFMIDLMHTLRS